MKKKYAIILAAGRGSGMESNNPSVSKVAYPILDKALVNYVLEAVKPIVDQIYVVASGENTKRLVANKATIIHQDKILGTGYGTKLACKELPDDDSDIIIINGDMPLITTETIQKVLHKHEKQGSILTIVSSWISNTKGYGRVYRSKPSNKVASVIPYAELSEYESDLEISEINSGIYIVNNHYLKQYVNRLNNDNNKNEYYLSDIVGLMFQDHLNVDAYVLEEPQELYNINNRVHLAYAAKLMRKRINTNLMLSGVSIEDPDTAYISLDVKIGKDSVILPNTYIKGDTVIGSNSLIGPNVLLENVKVGNNVKISFASLKDCEIKDGEIISVNEKR